MSNSEVTEIEEADPYQVAQTIALNALGPRAKSRDELFKHLKKRGTDPEIADSVLDKLELYGFVNDLEFAKAWRDSRQRAKKLGKRVIAKELREKESRNTSSLRLWKRLMMRLSIKKLLH